MSGKTARTKAPEPTDYGAPHDDAPSAYDDPVRLAAMRGEATAIGIGGWMRLIIRMLLIVALLIVLVPAHYLYRITAYGSPFPKYFLKYAARILGAKVKLIGKPLKRDVFFLSNHISWLDILVLAGASGTAFVSKAELGEVPVVGWLARLNRTVFVKRENRMAVAEQIAVLKEALSDNWSVTVFPEGTTTDGHSLLPFKTSMLKVLEPPPPGIVVQPVVLNYGAVSEWFGWVGEESGVNSAKRVFARRGTFPLHIHYLEPFSPADYPGRKAIGAQARAQMEPVLQANLGKPLRDFAHDFPPVGYEAPDSATKS